jgi:hypothetical protein
MTYSHCRHDISDEVWAQLETHLPGRQGVWGGLARDNRQFINAVFWIMRTGAPWRDLPPDYGDWSNTHRRFIRWRDKGILSRDGAASPQDTPKTLPLSSPLYKSDASLSGQISRDLCKTIHFCCRFLKTQFKVEILGNFGEFFARTKR